MSIMYLGIRNFVVDRQLLKCRINSNTGFALVLFYSTECNYCVPVTKLFSHLAQEINGCIFAFANITSHPGIVEMSRATNTRIEYVPLAILYYNGEPVFKYNSPYTLENLKSFIMESSNKVKQHAFGQTSSASAVAPTAPKIPPYTVGVPVCSDEVCYISYEKAYDKNNVAAPSSRPSAAGRF